MPHIAISMIPGRDHDTKVELSHKVQDYLAEELQIDKKYITVSIEDIEPQNWDSWMKKIPDDIMYIKPEE